MRKLGKIDKGKERNKKENLARQKNITEQKNKTIRKLKENTNIIYIYNKITRQTYSKNWWRTNTISKNLDTVYTIYHV